MRTGRDGLGSGSRRSRLLSTPFHRRLFLPLVLGYDQSITGIVRDVRSPDFAWRRSATKFFRHRRHGNSSGSDGLDGEPPALVLSLEPAPCEGSTQNLEPDDVLVRFDSQTLEAKNITYPGARDQSTNRSRSTHGPSLAPRMPRHGRHRRQNGRTGFATGPAYLAG